MSEVKFSVFADLHYLPGIFFTEAEERLKQIAERAKSANVVSAEFTLNFKEDFYGASES